MKTLIGGAVATILGIIGIVVWFNQFVIVLTGIIPAMLLMGGALAAYLGFDELKDSWKKDDTTEDTPAGSDEIEKYKSEVDDLKKEIETLKGKEEETKEKEEE